MGSEHGIISFAMRSLTTTTTVKKYVQSFGIPEDPAGRGPPKIGGNSFDITKMSPEERAEHASDEKDPLADVPPEVLQEKRLEIQ